MSRVLNVLLSHQEPRDLPNLLSYWAPFSTRGDLLLVYGGPPELFRDIRFDPKIHSDDPRLRTRDHQRERQSYAAIWREVARWLSHSGIDFEFIHIMEHDHIPLIPDLNERQIALLNSERADVLGYHLQRIDGTSYAHYLYHCSDVHFHQLFSGASMRREKNVVLAMLGTGSFWTRDAFAAVANCEEPFPIYLEIYLPTLAHHLGFRVRDYGAQNEFVSNLGDRSNEIESARARGAWSLHPVKEIPSTARTS